MNTRVYFILTAVSGMIGMLSLITLNLCQYWISDNPPARLSDQGIDQIHTIALTSVVTSYICFASISSFVVFSVLYFVSRRRDPASE